MLILFSILACLPLAVTTSTICPPDMPSDWLESCQTANLFYHPPPSTTTTTTNPPLLPSFGNGYLSTFVDSDTIYSGGLFNGDAVGNEGSVSHRATIPSYLIHVNASVPRTTMGQALDVQRAAFLKRFKTATLHIEERYYAPLDKPNVLVHEIQVTPLPGAATTPTNNKVQFTGTLMKPSSLDLNVTSTVSQKGVLERVGTTLTSKFMAK